MRRCGPRDLDHSATSADAWRPILHHSRRCAFKTKRINVNGTPMLIVVDIPGVANAHVPCATEMAASWFFGPGFFPCFRATADHWTVDWRAPFARERFSARKCRRATRSIWSAGAETCPPPTKCRNKRLRGSVCRPRLSRSVEIGPAQCDATASSVLIVRPVARHHA